MKKRLFICVLIALGLTSLSAQAQMKIHRSLEVTAGVGFGKGPIFTVYPQYVMKTEVGSGFNLGVGTAARISMPCESYIQGNTGETSKEHSVDFDIPVFIRVGYGYDCLFFNVDAGYAIGIFSIALRSTPTHDKGFFVEPHVGWKIGERNSLALGLLFQQNDIRFVAKVMEDGSFSQTVSYKRVFTPAITLRYVFF